MASKILLYVDILFGMGIDNYIQGLAVLDLYTLIASHRVKTSKASTGNFMVVIGIV